MRKILIVLIILFLTMHCGVKSKITTSKSIMLNETEHIIDIIFYKDGNKATTINSLSLAPYSVAEVDKKIDDPSSFAVNLIPYDSVQVVFGKMFKSTHYVNINGTNPKGIKKDTLRNLSAGSNWQKKIIEDTRKKFSVEYNYSFNQQDYLDATK